MAENQPEELENSINQLRVWLRNQPKFPQDIEDKLLKRFLHSSYNNVEKAKNVMELFFDVRTALPTVLRDRDPLSEEIQNAISITKLAFIQTPSKQNIWIFHLDDPGLRKYEYLPTVKLSFLQIDAWLLEDEILEEEDIVIMDVRDISFKILTRLDLSIEKLMHKYQQEAVPIRLKQVHIVNVPSFFSMVYSLMKPLLNKDVKEKIQFHSPRSTTLLNFLNKDDLPEEYGGTNGTMVEHTKNVINIIVRNREQLLKDNLWTVGEENSRKEDKDVKKASDIDEQNCPLVID